MDLDEHPAGGTGSLEDDRAYAARVTDPPAGSSDLWVTFASEAHEHKHGPCRFQPVPGETPAVGDRCLVARADGVDEWWVVQFDSRDITPALAPLVTSLPASPTDGDVVHYLADAANGIVWPLRYRAASPSVYKWEAVGAAPLVATVDTSEATGNTTFVALATPGPSITLPLAGDYDVEIGARCAGSAALTPVMSYDVGGTGATDADALAPTVTAAAQRPQGSRLRRKTGLAAVTLAAKYRTTTAGTATFDFRWMRVWPRRVI